MQILITEWLYVPSDRCEARREEAGGEKSGEKETPGACAGGDSRGGRTEM